jgi:hypothetical protein
MKHKKQHYIPESYLSAWCDPSTPLGQEPYIWMFSKNGEYIHRKAPKNIFYEANFYTINRSNGERDLSLEHGLSQIETRFAVMRREILEKHFPLSEKDHVTACAFTAAMYARTKASEDRARPIWQELLDKIKKMEEWFKTAPPEKIKKAMPSLISSPETKAAYITTEEIQQIVASPVKTLLTEYIMTAIPLLEKLDLAIIETSTKPGFITSDDPCVWFDPHGYKRPYPYQGPALMYPSIEIHLPSSPTQCLFFNRQGQQGYIELAKYGPLVDAQVVAEANWRTRLNAREYFVTNCNELLLKWFIKSP